MSSSITAAKRRRAGVETPAPALTNQTNNIPANPAQQQRTTLPQILSVFDARLTRLERNTTETMPEDDKAKELAEYITEMDGKFTMLVEEIAMLKDIVMKLQSYTMDVNKMLLVDYTNVGNNTAFDPLLVDKYMIREEDISDLDLANETKENIEYVTESESK